MGTKTRVDQLPEDDFDDWGEDYPEEQPIRKKARNRWRDIEDKLERRRLHQEICDDYDFEDNHITR